MSEMLVSNDDASTSVMFAETPCRYVHGNGVDVVFQLLAGCHVSEFPERIWKYGCVWLLRGVVHGRMGLDPAIRTGNQRLDPRAARRSLQHLVEIACKICDETVFLLHSTLCASKAAH